MFLRPSITVLVALSLLVPASPVPAVEESEDWSIERREWQGELVPETPVRVVNHHGEVRIRGYDQRLVEAIYVVQRHAEDPSRPELRVDDDGGRLRLTVAYPSQEDRESLPEAWRKRRVDLTVFVPRDAPVVVETLHGGAQIKGMEAGLEVRSESGEVKIFGAADVRAESKYGNLEVRFRTTDWPRPPVLETVTGSLLAELPFDARARAEVETRGEITTDFSMTIEWLTEGALKRGTAVIDGGERPLHLKSERGNVRLLRSRLATEPRSGAT